MKRSLLATLALLCVVYFGAALAKAEVRIEIEAIGSYWVDGDTAFIMYTIGAGYQDHRTEVGVQLTRKDSGEYEAQVRVYDVTDEKEDIEYRATMRTMVNLKKLIDAEFEKLGVKKDPMGKYPIAQLQFPKTEDDVIAELEEQYNDFDSP